VIKRIILAAGAVLVLVAAFALKESEKGDVRTAPGRSGAEPVEAALPRLVDLGADKCIPCKKMAPILVELSETFDGVFRVEFIDVWKNPGAAREWGIRVIPTQVFIDASGTERFRHQGFMAREAILAKWTELGVELPPKPSGTGS
jgi:thioredoxin 1